MAYDEGGVWRHGRAVGRARNNGRGRLNKTILQFIKAHKHEYKVNENKLKISYVIKILQIKDRY